MYYKNRSKELSANIGAVLNDENVARSLMQTDIVKMAESLPMGGRPPQGQRPQQSGGQRPSKPHNDFALMQALYGGVAKKLLPYVKKTVKKNMYNGSPGLRPIGPDREFVDKVTEEVVKAARRDFDEADEICLDKVCEKWNEKRLLYDLAQVMVLAEIFLLQRGN